MFLLDWNIYLNHGIIHAVRIIPYLNMVVLLYADDTVVFADSETEFVLLFDTFLKYCNLWKLHVNIDKTKIDVFCDKEKNILVPRIKIKYRENLYLFHSTFFNRSRQFYLPYIRSKNTNVIQLIVQCVRMTHTSYET